MQTRRREHQLLVRRNSLLECRRLLQLTHEPADPSQADGALRLLCDDALHPHLPPHMVCDSRSARDRPAAYKTLGTARSHLCMQVLTTTPMLPHRYGYPSMRAAVLVLFRGEPSPPAPPALPPMPSFPLLQIQSGRISLPLSAPGELHL